MAELPEKLQQTLDDLALFPDRADRIQWLISMAERFEAVPESIASRPFPESHRVPGCESEAFVWALAQRGDSLQLHFAVENPQGVSAMALAVILRDGLCGLSLKEVLAVPADVVYQIFGNELSMGKSLGLMGMVCAVHAEARKALGGSR